MSRFTLNSSLITISVIIPVKNGAATLDRCLQSIQDQTAQPIEIIVIDSASEDESVSIAKKHGAKIITISPEDFDHGLTRNLGVQNAKGDLIFLTVQDARLAEKNLLERMAHHFDDLEVKAVTGHQAVPHEKDKNPVRWFHRYSDFTLESRQIMDVKAFLKLPQKQQSKLIAWDNVIAMYRRSALINLPFVQTAMSEDWMWSYQALQKGWKLIRDSSLVVYHYHHLTPNYVFKSTWSVNYHFFRFFEYKPSLPKIIKPFAQVVYHLFKNKELSLREKFYWSRHNLSILISRRKADTEFLRKLKSQGQRGIENTYHEYCENIPLGRQK